MRSLSPPYSQWSPRGEIPNHSANIDIGNGVRDVLPRFRVHVRVLRAIRARISNEDDGGLLGTLGARSLLGDGIDLPSTLFADSFLPTRASALATSLDLPQRLLIPVVKCENVPVPRAMRGGALRWKRLNNQSSIELSKMQLLQGAVALACVTGNSLALVLAFEAPPFTMWVTTPTDGPLVEDTSLSLALSAATSLRPGESMGLLARLNDDGRVVTPVHASERPNTLAGAWSLGDFYMARTAAASYVLRVSSQRNKRIRRRLTRDADDGDTDTDARRDVVFFLAHYSSLRCGAPMLFRCTARVAREPETYVATVRDEDADEDMDTLVADFETASRIAADERHQAQTQVGENGAAPGSLELLVGKVDALRTALDTRGVLSDSPGEELIPDSTTSATSGASSLENRARTRSEAMKAPKAEENSGYGNLPRAIRVDFESEDLRDWNSGRAGSSKDETATSRGAGDTHTSTLGMEETRSWRLVDRLARKYLGDEYSVDTR